MLNAKKVEFIEELIKDMIREFQNDKKNCEMLHQDTEREEGKIEAPEGLHDDHMMGLAIAHEVRLQVVFPSNPINVAPHYSFDVEQQNAIGYDRGSKRTVI